ncbi:MAG: Fe-S cluster assembly protein SufD [Myxococcaceae bacterium]|nr:Fe-S cluster assembly protein SufD [Myxococcaceae bacterium]MCI0673594.1 Fe-S cluster assembly protein SufD [Myxococcaceae bacterium]
MTTPLQRALQLAERFGAAHEGQAPAWVRRERSKGLEALVRRGLPQAKEEAWRYTPLRMLYEAPHVPVEREALRMPDDAAWASFFLPRPAARLVFLDGHFVASWSVVPDSLPGLTVKPLSRAFREDGEVLHSLLGGAARPEVHPYVALNAALLAEGAFVRLAPGAELPGPIQLLLLSGSATVPALACPRVVVLAGAGSHATLVEVDAEAGPGDAFTDVVTEVYLEDGAQLHHLVLQQASMRALHLSVLHATQGAGSRFTSHVVELGGALARSEVRVSFIGEDAASALFGLYVGTGTQHLDHRTDVEHTLPSCTSEEVYKGVLTGKAHGIFHGRVRVRPMAFKTDARQVSKTLLLSDGATVDARPELEILADDVKCAHGAAVGRLDEDALFYLRSRGVPRAEAERLLTRAFVSEVLETIPAGPVRERVAAAVEARLESAAAEVSA